MDKVEDLLKKMRFQSDSTETAMTAEEEERLQNSPNWELMNYTGFFSEIKNKVKGWDKSKLQQTGKNFKNKKNLILNQEQALEDIGYYSDYSTN